MVDVEVNFPFLSDDLAMAHMLVLHVEEIQSIELFEKYPLLRTQEHANLFVVETSIEGVSFANKVLQFFLDLHQLLHETGVDFELVLLDAM